MPPPRITHPAIPFSLVTLLLTLKGTPFLYYGEEIRMRDIRLRRSQIVDPPGKLYWPLYRGRDGCRGPMQWDDNPGAGFSTGLPWLPVNPDYRFRNVARQAEDPHSRARRRPAESCWPRTKPECSRRSRMASRPRSSEPANIARDCRPG